MLLLSLILIVNLRGECTDTTLDVDEYEQCVNTILGSSIGANLEDSVKEFKTIFSNLPYFYELSNLATTNYSSQQVNLYTEFERLSADTPFEFLQKVQSLLRKTYDTANFIVPTQYKDYVLTLPFTVSLEYSSTTTFQILDGQYLGYIITKIEDLDPREAITKFAEESVRGRSGYARWNLAIKHMFRRPLTLYPIPSSRTIKLTLQKPNSDELPITDDFAWVVKNAAETEAAVSTHTNLYDTSFHKFDVEDPNIECGYYDSTLLSAKIGVMRIHSFTAATDRCTFHKAAVKYLNKLLQLDCRSLYLDLRSTTGDDLYLANSLFRVLWPSQFPVSPKQDFQLTDIGKLEAKWLEDNSAAIRDYDGTVDIDDLYEGPWYKKYQTATLEENIPYCHPFSRTVDFLSQQCAGTESRYGTVQFTPDSFYILSDGIASPVAAQFIHHVKESQLGWSFMTIDSNYEGGDDAVMSIAPSAAFAITSAHLKNDLHYELNYLNDLTFSFAFAESYSFNYSRRAETYGLGFIVNTPDRTLSYTTDMTTISLENSYQRAYHNTDSDIARVCAPWMVKKDSYCPHPGNNQIQGHPCVGQTTESTWDRDTCVFAECAKGYYVNHTVLTHCRPTPDFTELGYTRDAPEGSAYQPPTRDELDFQSTIFGVGLVILILAIIYLSVMALAGCAVRRKQ